MKKTKLIAELRTIGLCDATDSELSIRHLAVSTISAVNSCSGGGGGGGVITDASIGGNGVDGGGIKHKMFYLSPYQQHSQALRRYRKNSSSESIAKSYKSNISDDGQSSGCGGSSSDKENAAAYPNRDIVLEAIQFSHHHNNNNKLSNNSSRSNTNLTATSTTTPTLTTTTTTTTTSNSCRRVVVSIITPPSPPSSENTYHLYHHHQHHRKQEPKKYHSAISRIRNESVMRSKSFQEQGVKPLLRNSRFFVNRHPPVSATAAAQMHVNSDFSLDTVSQNIEITVQDDDGVHHLNEDDDGFNSGGGGWHRIGGRNLTDANAGGHSFSSSSTTTTTTTAAFDRYGGGGSGGGSTENEQIKSGHILGRILRRMRKISFGWKKSKCKIRRGDL